VSSGTPKVLHIPTTVGKLCVEDRGSGKIAVVLWHSLLCDGSMWRHQTADLERDHRVLVVEGPGHGRSERAPRPFTLDDCADALVQILDAHALEKAVLVGLSWGGMTSMRVAIRAPERVRALALLDTSADAETFVRRWRYRVMAALFGRWGFLSLLERPVLEAMFAPATLAARPAFVDELVEIVRKGDRAGLVAATKAVVIERTSCLAQLKEIKAPTLVVVGGEDRATSPRRAERIAAAIPGARLEVVAGAGHLSALERPDAVTSLLRGFIDSLE